MQLSLDLVEGVVGVDKLAYHNVYKQTSIPQCNNLESLHLYET